MPERIGVPATPTSRPTGWYRAASQAEHEKHCDRCRTLTEEIDARYAANAASIARRDRRDLQLTPGAVALEARRG